MGDSFISNACSNSSEISKALNFIVSILAVIFCQWIQEMAEGVVAWKCFLLKRNPLLKCLLQMSCHFQYLIGLNKMYESVFLVK
jgi:hypothetical protein